MVDRRGFLAITIGTAIGRSGVSALTHNGHTKMYGLISKIVAVDGRREELGRILIDGTDQMPGCLSYVVALDAEDGNALWVTEVWETQASHQRSLSLPSVQTAITEGRTLIHEFAERWVTSPLGGHELD